MSRTTRITIAAAVMGVSEVVAIAGAGVVACSGSNNRSPQTPVELQIGKIADLQEGGVNANGERHDARCSVRLVASRIEKSSPGCYLDEHISEGPGVLRYPCEGDGPAEADFGDHRYAGHINRGEVLVELVTELDWEDGCRWGTLAAITGRITTPNGAGASGSARLNWNYLDRVITGSDCSGVCNARTTLAVSAKDAPNRKPHDDDVDLDEDRD